MVERQWLILSYKFCKMKYFGIFAPQTLDLTDLEIENLMLENGLLVINSVANGNNLEDIFLNIQNNSLVTQINPSKELVDEYYKFIIDLYQTEILKIKLPFFKKFNDAIFGLEHTDQKKIALKHFKEIYNVIYKDAITFFNETINNDGIVHTNPIDKLKMLYYQLEAYKNNLSGTRTSMYYLVGDRQTYIDSNFIENEIVTEVLEFEAWKQVLVELNSRYGFEEDDSFSTIIKDDGISDFTNPDEVVKPTKESVINEREFENNDKLSNSKNNIPLFINFIRHKNKIEIEQIIKTHYSDLRGVSLRYLIEFLKEEGVLVLNHGDATKFYNSIKMLFEGKNIGAYPSIFDKKVFSSNDTKYITTKMSFAKMFKDFL